MPKIALLVSFYFPPYANVNVMRTSKFCKYLPEFGWTPWVLSVDPRYYRGRVVEKISPDVAQTRLFRWPYLRFPGNLLVLKLSFPLLILAFVVRHYRKIGVVYFSGSPFYQFPLTVFLTGLLHIPTVLDFRDSWSINHGYDGRRAAGWRAHFRQWFYGLIEKVSIRHASAVVFATKNLRDEYAQLFPDFKGKYETITNGFDPQDFTDIQPKRVTKGDTLIMAGQFHVYTPQAVSGLLQVLKNLPELNFIYVGEEHETIRKLAESAGVESQVTVFPFQPYQEVINLVAGSDYAMVASGLPNLLGTKIFDYLALNKPTLCLVPEHSEISRQFGGIESILICEPPYTLEKISDNLRKLLATKAGDSLPRELAAFSRREAARRLSEIFENIRRS